MLRMAPRNGAPLPWLDFAASGAVVQAERGGMVVDAARRQRCAVAARCLRDVQLGRWGAGSPGARERVTRPLAGALVYCGSSLTDLATAR